MLTDTGRVRSWPLVVGLAVGVVLVLVQGEHAAVGILAVAIVITATAAGLVAGWSP
jgi:hypothetical protein